MPTLTQGLKEFYRWEKHAGRFPMMPIFGFEVFEPGKRYWVIDEANYIVIDVDRVQKANAQKGVRLEGRFESGSFDASIRDIVADMRGSQLAVAESDFRDSLDIYEVPRY